LKRATAAGIEGRGPVHDSGAEVLRKDGEARAFQARQRIEVIVDRLERAIVDIPQELMHAAFGFAGV